MDVADDFFWKLLQIKHHVCNHRIWSMFCFVVFFILVCGVPNSGGHKQEQQQQRFQQHQQPKQQQQQKQEQKPQQQHRPSDHIQNRKNTVKSITIAFQNVTDCSATQPCCRSRTYSRSGDNIVVGTVHPSLDHKSILPFSWNPQEVISGRYYHAMSEQSSINNVGFDKPVALMQQLQHPAVYFDVGANCGITALPVAAMTYNHSVYAFEPAPSMMDSLCYALGHDILTGTSTNPSSRRFDNLHLTEAIVTNVSTTSMDLYVPISRADNAAVSMKSAEKVNAVGGLKKMSVSGVTIDAFVREHNITNIALLKIDTQGHEYMVLQGAKHSLKSGIITTVFCENAPNLMEASGIDINEYYNFMISLGFLPYNEIDNLLMVKEDRFVLNENLIVSNSKPQPLRALNSCPDNARNNQQELLKSYCTSADIFWIANITNH